MTINIQTVVIKSKKKKYGEKKRWGRRRKKEPEMGVKNGRKVFPLKMKNVFNV